MAPVLGWDEVAVEREIARSWRDSKPDGRHEALLLSDAASDAARAGVRDLRARESPRVVGDARE